MYSMVTKRDFILRGSNFCEKYRGEDVHCLLRAYLEAIFWKPSIAYHVKIVYGRTNSVDKNAR